MKNADYNNQLNTTMCKFYFNPFSPFPPKDGSVPLADGEKVGMRGKPPAFNPHPNPLPKRERRNSYLALNSRSNFTSNYLSLFSLYAVRTTPDVAL